MWLPQRPLGQLSWLLTGLSETPADRCCGMEAQPKQRVWRQCLPYPSRSMGIRLLRNLEGTEVFTSDILAGPLRRRSKDWLLCSRKINTIVARPWSRQFGANWKLEDLRWWWCCCCLLHADRPVSTLLSSTAPLSCPSTSHGPRQEAGKSLPSVLDGVYMTVAFACRRVRYWAKEALEILKDMATTFP